MKLASQVVGLSCTVVRQRRMESVKDFIDCPFSMTLEECIYRANSPIAEV
jgi:hypothetical protein